MIHPDTEIRFISQEVGYGVVATKFLPAGTITWVHDQLDREFTLQQLNDYNDLYKNILETYCYRNNKGNYILCWDHGRYVNHSFKSNCLSTAYDFEIAIRDIHVGEQLTDDYGYLNVSEPFEPIDEGTDRKVVYPDDLLNFHQEWDTKINAAFPNIINVEQALLPVMHKKIWAKVESLIKKQENPESILVNHYPEK
ncbi:hypothetical protein SAMN03097699_1290 [Flavobacteriaceae bacterium MAR_2010_188]|nr:hypothetical protein SAMN03097699_1290 [Flavobacteriaceae bacterium MAR_2010_188]